MSMSNTLPPPSGFNTVRILGSWGGWSRSCPIYIFMEQVPIEQHGPFMGSFFNAYCTCTTYNVHVHVHCSTLPTCTLVIALNNMARLWEVFLTLTVYMHNIHCSTLPTCTLVIGIKYCENHN